MGALRDRVAVVTGAEQPLGRGLALALADAGALVALVGDAVALAPAVAELESRATRALAVAGTLTDRGSLEAALATAGDELGSPPGALVHAATPEAAFERRPLEEVDDARFDAVWEATMLGALALLQAAHTQLARPGRVVLVTPTVSMSGAPGLAPYAAALEGERLLAKSAARQWGPDGITVNCLAPAPEQVPVDAASGDVSLAPPALGGPGDAEADLGPALVFLVSDDAHFVTGATLCVDGGVWMAP